jgi:hypothetical protein
MLCASEMGNAPATRLQPPIDLLAAGFSIGGVMDIVLASGRCRAFSYAGVHYHAEDARSTAAATIAANLVKRAPLAATG